MLTREEGKEGERRMDVDCSKRWQIELSMLYISVLFSRRSLKGRQELCM